MRLFMVQFDEDATTITYEVETKGDVRAARTIRVPNHLAPDAVIDAQASFLTLAQWATDPERYEEPDWSRPDAVTGVECDGDILQLTWATGRGGIETQHAIVVAYEDVQEMALEAFGDIEDIIDTVQPVLESP